MGFESVHLTTPSPFDAPALRAWLAAKPWAFVDPHGSGGLHISGCAEDARRALDARRANPHQYLNGVVVWIRSDGLSLEARADAAALARARGVVARALATGTWQMRRDWLDFDEPADIDVLFDRDLPQPEDLGEVRIVTWLCGDEDDPAGAWELQVRNGSEVELSVRRGGQERHLTGELSVAARQAWLEATAHLDEDDDAFLGDLPRDRQVRLAVETPDKEWALFFDVQAPPPSVRPLAAMIALWRPALRDHAGGPLDLPEPTQLG